MERNTFFKLFKQSIKNQNLYSRGKLLNHQSHEDLDEIEVLRKSTLQFLAELTKNLHLVF